MMKAMGGGGKRGLGGALGNLFGLGGGMPQPTPEQIAALQKQMGGAGLPPGLGGGGKGALPGLGGPKLPGLGGFPFGGGKKK